MHLPGPLEPHRIRTWEGEVGPQWVPTPAPRGPCAKSPRQPAEGQTPHSRLAFLISSQARSVCASKTSLGSGGSAPLTHSQALHTWLRATLGLTLQCSTHPALQATPLPQTALWLPSWASCSPSSWPRPHHFLKGCSATQVALRKGTGQGFPNVSLLHTEYQRAERRVPPPPLSTTWGNATHSQSPGCPPTGLLCPPLLSTSLSSRVPLIHGCP